jgi:UDP-N-acetylglucosamine--N-acetylmuramyl-(pentapeptide) pyrophosphoryl-undecaprenol N-acetylglucosamine transferase
MQLDAGHDPERKVVIAAGGTAGHVKPALAIADALRVRGARVSFIGTGAGSGHGLVLDQGYEEDVVPMRGFARSLSPSNLRTIGLTLAAIPRAMRILRARQADAVVGGGGYMAGPVAIAARLLGIPLLLTEADSHLGLANRLAAPYARRVALAFPVVGRVGEKYVVTGRPIDHEVANADRAAARVELGIASDEPCVLVTGGSQGARTLNTAIVTAYGTNPPFTLIHIAGGKQVDDVRALLGAEPDPEHYRLMGFTDRFHQAVAAADLVVSRSGGTVFELAAIGRPSILVPYPHATADHQTKNAMWLVEAGAAEMIPDHECTPERLRDAIDRLMADPGLRARMSHAARSVARPDAADRIAEMIEQMVSE